MGIAKANTQFDDEPSFIGWPALISQLGLGGLLLVLFFVIKAACLLALTGFVYLLWSGEDYDALMDVVAMSGFNASISGICAAAISGAGLVLVCATKNAVGVTEDLALIRVSPLAIVLSVGGLALYVLVVSIVNQLLERPALSDSLAIAYQTAVFVPLLWFAIVVVASVFEEALFRGYLFGIVASSPLGSLGAVFLTALTWSLIHSRYQAIDLAFLFLLGLLLGFVRWKTKSIFACILIHSSYNALALYGCSTVLSSSNIAH